MVTVLALLGVLGVLFAAAVLSTREQGLLAEASPDDPDVPLPDEPLTPDDVGRLRFSMAARGYRMSEVDLALERLAKELADRDRRIGLLEAAARGTSKPESVAPVREATPQDLPVPEERVAPSVVVAPAPVAPPPAAPPLDPRTDEPLPAPENAGEAGLSEAGLSPGAPESPAAAESPAPSSPSSPRPGAWSSPSAVPAFPVIDAPDADLPQPDLPSRLVAEEQADDRADLDNPADERPR